VARATVGLGRADDPCDDAAGIADIAAFMDPVIAARFGFG
jgi:hypothetical protein